ncbi:O-acetylhomoserine aminocarboxypropyltransferase [Hyphomonas sp. FCG-A18]|uniref:O-acetylhomoserine aminocarboxypropyltransferase n=1 Tax=Hyphomonas sp. FCG-A18 TaxID=3080019 RepID=UPI002B2EF226|nr:O-acetylhomoserine aminocarboxypropyltransferase [Hyphomonas sp. FCG-A18]
MTQGFSTRALHAGAAPDPVTGSRAQPIHQTTSFVFKDAEHASKLFALQEFGNIYTRLGNPTTGALEERIANLEGGTMGVATASGHAAQLLAFHVLMEPGTKIVAAKQLYGGSINQLGHAFKKFGWRVEFVDINDGAAVEAAMDDTVRVIFSESLANPGGVVTDMAQVAAIAKKHGVVYMVDNTMASPYLCQPLQHGANIVVNSLTKFIGGHGNSIGGMLVDGGNFDWKAHADKYPTMATPQAYYNDLNFAEGFGALPLGPDGAAVDIAFAIAARAFSLRDLGPALSPFNAFMILTGCETLPLRMDKHCANATAVAEYLSGHEKVSWVQYAGLAGDKYHALAQTYCPKGAGAVFTFGLKGGHEAGVKLVEHVKLFSHLANIGDTRSLIIHPSSTTHSQLSDAQKTAAGAAPDTVRLSVGIEDAADIIADLQQALAVI